MRQARLVFETTCCNSGAASAMEKGALVGHPVQGVRVVLEDGQTHPVDSSDMAFRFAASAAVRESMLKAGAQVLEPIMSVEVGARHTSCCTPLACAILHCMGAIRLPFQARLGYLVLYSLVWPASRPVIAVKWNRIAPDNPSHGKPPQLLFPDADYSRNSSQALGVLENPSISANPRGIQLANIASCSPA